MSGGQTSWRTDVVAVRATMPVAVSEVKASATIHCPAWPRATSGVTVSSGADRRVPSTMAPLIPTRSMTRRAAMLPRTPPIRLSP